MAIAPIELPWNDRIDRFIIVLQTAFHTGSFGAYNATISRDLDSNIDHTKTFHKFIDSGNFSNGDEIKQTAETIKDVNEKAVSDGQANYKEFSDNVENLKNSTPDQEEWERKIDNAAEVAKKKSDDAIDAAKNKAKEIIGTLPPEAREGATNIFVSGLQAVAQFFQNVWSQIEAVARSVLNFLAGIWDKIKVAWDVVKGAANTAVDWIKGLFGASATFKDSSSTSHDRGNRVAHALSDNAAHPEGVGYQTHAGDSI